MDYELVETLPFRLSYYFIDLWPLSFQDSLENFKHYLDCNVFSCAFASKCGPSASKSIGNAGMRQIALL